MSCEHLEHRYEDCSNCQQYAWACVDDMRDQRDDALATIADLRAALVEATRYCRCVPCRNAKALLERTKP